MKLIKLLPAQIMEYWEYIRECIAEALPPFVEDNSSSFLVIQEQLLIGSMQCWFITHDTVPSIIYAVVTTRTVIDDSTFTKNLLLFSVTSTEDHPVGMWEEAYSKFKLYAKSQYCNKIIAFSDNELVIRLAKSLGADINWRLIQFPVAKEIL